MVWCFLSVVSIFIDTKVVAIYYYYYYYYCEKPSIHLSLPRLSDMFRRLKVHLQTQMLNIKHKVHTIAGSHNSYLIFTNPVYILQHNMVEN